MNASIEIQNGVKTLSGAPADAKYYNNAGTPYTNVDEVNSQIPSALRGRGLTVNVAGVEYWYKDGILDSNLVEKITAGSGGTTNYSDLTNKPTINSVQLTGNKTAADLYLATKAQGDKADTALQSLPVGTVIDANYATNKTNWDSKAAGNHTHPYEPLKGADDNYVTDAEKVVLDNTSGINTGDETNATIKTKLGTDLTNKLDKNAAITAATKTKITYDNKGLVTAGTDLSESDIPTLSQSKITNLVTDLSSKQPTLVSGTNIKTINNQSILGGGDIVIEGSTSAAGISFSATGSIASTNVQAAIEELDADISNLTKELVISKSTFNSIAEPGIYLNNATAKQITGFRLSSNATDFTITINGIAYTKDSTFPLTLAANAELIINDVTIQTGYNVGNVILILQ